MENDIQVLDGMRKALLNIPDIAKYSDGNIYVTYLDELSLFPCITIFFIASKNAAAEKDISLQIKTWTLNNEPETELLTIYKILFDYFDTRKALEWEIKEVYQEFRNNATLNPWKLLIRKDAQNPNIETIEGTIDERILKEKLIFDNETEIDVFSMPLVLAAKKIKTQMEAGLVV